MNYPVEGETKYKVGKCLCYRDSQNGAKWTCGKIVASEKRGYEHNGSENTFDQYTIQGKEDQPISGHEAYGYMECPAKGICPHTANGI